jgi:hypothetical protein
LGSWVGLFSYKEAGDGGAALFDRFRYDYDGPKFSADSVVKSYAQCIFSAVGDGKKYP